MYPQYSAVVLSLGRVTVCSLPWNVTTITTQHLNPTNANPNILTITLTLTVTLTPGNPNRLRSHHPGCTWIGAGFAHPATRALRCLHTLTMGAWSDGKIQHTVPSTALYLKEARFIPMTHICGMTCVIVPFAVSLTLLLESILHAWSLMAVCIGLHEDWILLPRNNLHSCLLTSRPSRMPLSGVMLYLCDAPCLQTGKALIRLTPRCATMLFWTCTMLPMRAVSFALFKGGCPCHTLDPVRALSK